MKDKGFAIIVIAFCAIVVGLALWSSIAGNIGKMTNIQSVTNATGFSMPASGATSELTMCGQEVRTILIVNSTGTVPSTNYTITSSVGTDGYLAAKLTTNGVSYQSRVVNVTCTYEDKGYIDESGSRAIVLLVAIGFALLIMIAALPNLRNGLKDLIGI